MKKSLHQSLSGFIVRSYTLPFLTLSSSNSRGDYAEMAEAIPSPRAIPFLGNALDVDAEYPITSLTTLAARYGKLEAKILGNLPKH